MKLIFLIFGATAFLALVLWASITGSLSAEFARVIELPWGLTMLVDLYIGLALFAFFIYAFEKSIFKTLPWFLALMLLGNLAALAYLTFRFKKVQKLFGEILK